MKRISRAARVTVLAWVAAVSLPLGQCFVPLANADETDPVPVPAATGSSDPEKPAEKGKSAEKAEPPIAEPAEDPAPVGKPAPPAAEKPAPLSEPDPASEPPSGQAPGPVEKAPPVADPTTEPPAETPPVSLPSESPPAETPSQPPAEDDPESPSAPRPEIPPASGSEDVFVPVPEDSLTAAPDSLLIGLEESLVEGIVEPMGIDPGDLCAIGADGYPTLDAAIAAAASGQTIAVLKSFTHTSPVVIDGKDLTFDLSEGSITIDTRGTTNSYALTLTNATITLLGGGYVDVMGDLRGVHARNASIAVRYATADWGTGAYAESGGKITVRGDAKGYLIGAFAYGAGSTVTVDDDAIATGAGARGAEAMSGGHVTAKNALAGGASGIGASASSSGTVTIAQEAKGTAVGARASDGGRITVGGKVTASGSGGTAAFAAGGGSVTIDGELTGDHYVQVGMVYKGEDDWEPVTTLPGYRTYRDGTSTVWVKGAPSAAGVCAIGDQEFPTLDDALATVDGTASAPTVIRLLTGIAYDKTLNIGAKHVVFQLDGFNLLVGGGIQTGLQVTGGTVGYTGPGAFVVTGGGEVVEVRDGGRATVNVILIADAESFGAYAAGDGSRVVVNGDIRTERPNSRVVGAYATGEGATVIVNGTIWIESDNGSGAVAANGGDVVVAVGGGDAITVTGDYAVGAFPHYYSTVTVTGDITANGADAVGVETWGGTARIAGDVTTSGAWGMGVAAYDFGEVTVMGAVTVTGSSSVGIYAQVGEGAGGIVDVTGTVTVSGPGALGAEASSRENRDGKSLVTIRGQLTAPDYLEVDGVPRAIDSQDSEDPSGFWLYQGRYGSLVKVRNGEPRLGPPTVVTKPVAGVTTSGASLSGKVTSDGGAAVSERGFVYSTSPDPTLASGTKVLAGSGTGEYDALLTGLQAGTAHYVRAYAINSEGTGYGGAESFVTQSEPSIEPTPDPTETPDPTPDPSETPEPTPEPTETPDPTPEPSDSASASESDELPATGMGASQLGWLLGLMAATMAGGLLLLFGKEHLLRRHG